VPTPRHDSFAAIDPVETVTPPKQGNTGTTGPCCNLYSMPIEMIWLLVAAASKFGAKSLKMLSKSAKTAIFAPKNGQNQGFDVTFLLTGKNCIFLNPCVLQESRCQKYIKKT
jgi:hypothetical protein